MLVVGPRSKYLLRTTATAFEASKMTVVEEGMLAVSGTHSLYYRVEGSPESVPVFIFHGGWGPRDSDGAFCDDEGEGRWRVIHLHQRGWGKSIPFGETRENSATDVIGDVEQLREHLGIERWIVVGGSTGAMLALLYGVEYPEAVQGIVLRGTWLLREKEIDWCYRGGMGHFYPEEWEAFCSHVGAAGGDDPVKLYSER